MKDLSIMELFVKNNRTLAYFKEEAIKEIKIGYHLMTYLKPDASFPTQINKNILELLLAEKYDEAYFEIEEEVGVYGKKDIKSLFIKVAKELRAQYPKTKRSGKRRKKDFITTRVKKFR